MPARWAGVFFHHRCVHSVGINTNPSAVRMAAIMDFQRARPPADLMWLTGGSSIQPDGSLSIWSQGGVRTPAETLASHPDPRRIAQCPWPDDVSAATTRTLTPCRHLRYPL